MSWDETIQQLRRKNYLKSRAVRDAMENVDRKQFIDTETEEAYADRPVPISHGQTVSAPHMVAIMTEALQPQAEDVVLEVGTGSGYQAAIFGELVSHVYTLERIKELAEQACDRLRAYKNVDVIQKDGFDGLNDHAPYDKIIVTAAPPSVPATLEQQLADGGRMVIPVGTGRVQQLKIYQKRDDTCHEVEQCGNVSFVPMKRD